MVSLLIGNHSVRQQNRGKRNETWGECQLTCMPIKGDQSNACRRATREPTVLIKVTHAGAPARRWAVPYVGRLADALAVVDLRRAHIAVHLELAAQAVHDDIQVQLSYSTHPAPRLA